MADSLISEIAARQTDATHPFMISGARALRFVDVAASSQLDLSAVVAGDVVAVIGDFEPLSITTLLNLIDRKAIIVPLTIDTRPDHNYFLETAYVNVVIEGGQLRREQPKGADHPMLAQLRDAGHAGLVLFSSGTTGRPKAILHDFEAFLRRFRTPRAALVTMSFLLFDHIGGINTLFHTMYNNGQVVVPTRRTPDGVVALILAHQVELLPTTPTFLRLLLLSGQIGRLKGSALKVITYGTERMDEPTLLRVAQALPDVDLRQTYGMSELGILRVKSRARDSLFMKVGGEGVQVRVDSANLLKIKSDTRMIGYLNAPSPFEADGWYNTRDLVVSDGEWLRIVGRDVNIINVGGQKILASEIERVALMHPDVALAKATGQPNPITGQHIEIIVQARDGVDLSKETLIRYFRLHLPGALQPHRIRMENVAIGHRFKQL